MVHSALSKIGNVEGGADAVIDSFFDAVGEEGTVLMPAFADAETVMSAAERGEQVDLRVQASLTGKITDVFRMRPGTRRSSHPFSSVAASGRAASHIVSGHALDPRIAHESSPMGRLLHLDGKVVGVGIGVAPLSFYHVIEDTWDEFPHHPYGESRTMSYIDAEGAVVEREIRRYRLHETRIDQPGSGFLREWWKSHLLSCGVLHEFTFGEAQSWFVSTTELYEEMRRLARAGITIYSTKEEIQRIEPTLPTSD